MNILVVGNGFDIAHGLPTRYGEFLDFAEALEEVLYSSSYTRGKNLNSNIDAIIRKNMNTNPYPKGDIWKQLLGSNIWIRYFLERRNEIGENWIDFENEILRVIKSIEEDMQGDIKQEIISLRNPFFNKRFAPDNGMNEELMKAAYGIQGTKRGTGEKELEETFEQVADRLITDLNRLIAAFEMYIIEYVHTIDILQVSPDIIGIANDIDAVLSFNYTGTYEKLYDKSRTMEYDFIHGEAKTEACITEKIMEDNNMVLGIDEYLSEAERNVKIDFIAFKKYYQRIHKETGCEYRTWLDDINKEGRMKILGSAHLRHDVYIFGHSLDTTDRDVLRDIILGDYIYTTIFYCNKKHHGQLIANLVKVIGQEELIRRTSGRDKTITFVKQKEMVPIKAEQTSKLYR